MPPTQATLFSGAVPCLTLQGRDQAPPQQTTHRRLSVRGHSLTFTSPNDYGQGLKELEGEEGIQTEAKSYTLNVL